jgi:ammonia channel protein AmtB
MGLTVVLSVVATAVIAYAVKAAIGLRPALDDEERGLDESDHGEVGYHPEEISGHSSVEPEGAMSASVPALAKP